MPQYYGGGRSYPRGSAIELKDNKVNSGKDEFGFTVACDGNSQESILAPEQKPADVLVSPKGAPENPKQRSIMKTQEVEVSVSYSSNSAEQARYSGSRNQW